jgi:hypothetical protein
MFNTIQFTCGSHLLQLFYSLFHSISRCIRITTRRRSIVSYRSRKVQDWKIVAESVRRRQLVLTPISSHRGKQLTMSFVDLGKTVQCSSNVHHLHSMHMLHYPAAKEEIPSASYKISTTTSSPVTHPNQGTFAKKNLD